MTAQIESTIRIERPLSEVFDFFLNLDKSAKADPTIESVEKATEGPVGAGTTFVFRQRALGKVRETKTRFVAVEPNRRIDFEAWIGPLRPRMNLTFEEAGDGTKVTVSGAPNPIGIFKLLSKGMSRKGQQSWEQRLVHVKNELESRT